MLFALSTLFLLLSLLPLLLSAAFAFLAACAPFIVLVLAADIVAIAGERGTSLPAVPIASTNWSGVRGRQRLFWWPAPAPW
jgi:hypothetical protein